jgi:hypothetical protein
VHRDQNPDQEMFIYEAVILGTIGRPLAPALLGNSVVWSLRCGSTDYCFSRQACLYTLRAGVESSFVHLRRLPAWRASNLDPIEREGRVREDETSFMQHVIFRLFTPYRWTTPPHVPAAIR